MFGYLFSRRRILLHCDNMAVVYIVNSGTSKDPDMMCLVRSLFFVCASHDLEVSCVYIASKANNIADALSRLDIVQFRHAAPAASALCTPIVPFPTDYSPAECGGRPFSSGRGAPLNQQDVHSRPALISRILPDLPATVVAGSRVDTASLRRPHARAWI